MKPSEDIWAFRAILHNDYRESCQALGVPNLNKSFNEILSYTLMAGMSSRARFIFSDPLINDCETTMLELEAIMKDPSARNLLFENKETTEMPNKTLNNKCSPKNLDISENSAIEPESTRKLCNVPYIKKTIDPNTLCDDTPNVSMHLPIEDRQLNKDHDIDRNTLYQVSYTHQQPKSDISKPRNYERLNNIHQWNDWKCHHCDSVNSGHYYRCLKCHAEATLRQIPSQSWKCKHCIHGRNNWAKYHYCSSCLEPNESIPKDKLHNKQHLIPFGRESTWYPILPIIDI